MQTNEDLALWAKALRDNILVCNVDKKALRSWAESIEEKSK